MQLLETKVDSQRCYTSVSKKIDVQHKLSSINNKLIYDNSTTDQHPILFNINLDEVINFSYWGSKVIPNSSVLQQYTNS